VATDNFKAATLYCNLHLKASPANFNKKKSWVPIIEGNFCGFLFLGLLEMKFLVGFSPGFDIQMKLLLDFFCLNTIQD